MLLRLLPLLPLLIACNAFEFSPWEERLSEDERDLNRRAIARIEPPPPGEPLRFVVLGDTQLWLDEARDAVKSVGRLEGISFVVQTGDYTNFGMRDEFRWLNEILSRLPVPYVAAIGNHDLLGNGGDIYEKMFGPKNFVFEVGRTRFVILDSNSLEYEFDGSVPDVAWLEEQLAPGPDFDRSVVVCHVPPDSADFDGRLVRPYADALRAGGVLLSIHGHLHHFDEGVLPGGVPFVVADSMEHRSYLVVTIDGDETSWEQVFF